MNRTRVKICGICRVEDALAAARAGADAIGMVFHPASARNVSAEVAERILAALPPFVTPVGLFVDASAEQVANFVGRLGLRHVQLHGRETPAVVTRVRATVIKAVRVDPGGFAQELAVWRRAIRECELRHLRGLVLETAGDGAPGGTGVANDWTAVRRGQEEGLFDGLPPMIAAGGLTPETVGAVVRHLRPWAVDVSSGVERAKGEKSEEKIRAFMEAVREADRA
jgi:phosphoribosylanthranilate isomerase